MNTSKLLSSALVAVAAFSASGAFAGDLNNYPAQTAQAGTMTRAQVRAELAQANRAGTQIKNNHDYPTDVAAAGSSLSREQVKAELRQAARAGYTPRIDNNFPDATAS